MIYRRAVFVKTGQLNELGGYKPRTSGRRTCKFYILKSFRVFYMSFFYFFSIYKSANVFFLLRILGYPVPFEARIYMCTQTHTYTHMRAPHRYVHDWLCITLRNVHSSNLLVESFVYIFKLNGSLSWHFLCCQILSRALLFHIFLRCISVVLATWNDGFINNSFINNNESFPIFKSLL